MDRSDGQIFLKSSATFLRLGWRMSTGKLLAWYSQQPTTHYYFSMWGRDKADIHGSRPIKSHLLKESRTQITFSLIPVLCKDNERNERILFINTWLHGCCHYKIFGFFLTAEWSTCYQPCSTRWVSILSKRKMDYWGKARRVNWQGFKLDVKGEKSNNEGTDSLTVSPVTGQEKNSSI